MGLFDSIVNITKDVTNIVLAPVEIAVDTTRVITKPVADLATEIKNEIKAEVKEITNDR